MGVTLEIAEWVASLRFEDIPSRIVEKAKTQILSMLGAVYASAGADVAGPLGRFAGAGHGAKEATLFPSGQKTSAQAAIFTNAALSMALDYDDYLFAGHTGHSAVLVPLALAEKLGLGGKDLLVAQIAANEVEGRIGASVILGPLNGQLWSFIHLAGGALAAGKLLGLSADRLASALGIAFLQPNHGLMAGFFGSESKALLASTTATAGVQAAELAAEGLEGFREILEHPQGFVQAFSPQPLMGAYRGLGRAWVTDTLCVKIYPGCAYVDTLVDCILDIAAAEPIDVHEVVAVRIAATPLTIGMDLLSAPHLRGAATSPVTLTFSVPYNAAVALLHNELTPRQLRRECIADPRIWSLASRVQLTLEPELTDHMRDASPLKPGADGVELDLGTADFSSFRMSFGARVEVELASGRVLSRTADVPRGAAGRPPGENRALAVEKFQREAQPFLGTGRVERVVQAVQQLERLSAVELHSLLDGLG